MSVLWQSPDAQAACLGRVSAPFAATGVSIDSRSLKAGDLFVALTGEARDGHEFVGAAFKAGAAAALVSRTLAADGPLLEVGHTLRALEDLADAARARMSGKVVAVTGSAGKTTTKEMLRLACSALGRVHASVASYNNHWGVPLTLAQMPRDCEYAVIEIGMNHFNEIRTLVRLARPHVALITTIAPAHIEFFGTLEAIADAKAEIFDAVMPGGAAILPADNPLYPRLVERARRAGITRLYSFGSNAGADGRLIETSENADGQRIVAEISGQPVRLQIAAHGQHIASNAVAALLAVAQVGGDVLNAAASLSTFTALKGRGARRRLRLKGGDIELIDESYNANPASMTAALRMLGATTGAGRRIAVLGDMLEMGAAASAYHRALADEIAAQGIDLVFACGAAMAELWQALPNARRGAYGRLSHEIAQEVVAALAPGDVVLIKGSLGSRMAVILDALTAASG
ncbi:MAG: UDP-N-acetylmuramoyl-tripeptide--D-alanyl-D-alanine ligase [Alphaproteobacteria bacterium]|nr:UDP-N-acetylmuramoyl-tripeptide--D-alanyl-D-alanine ligase [Alphaproteobacteria bacterium]